MENKLTTTSQGLVKQANQNILLNPPAFTLNENLVYNTILAAVIKSFINLGYKQPDKTTMDLMVHELTKNIIEKHKQIRLEEIDISFYKGIRKEFGEFVGLSVVTFETFIKNYLVSRDRAEMAKEAQRIMEKQQSSEPTDLEKFDTFKNLAVSVYREQLNGKDISLTAPTIFIALERLKIAQFSNEEKLDFLEESKQVVLEKKKYSRSIAADRSIRHQISRQIESIGTDKDVLIESYKKEARHLALVAFFQMIQMEEQDLGEIIEGKKTEYLESLK